MLTPEIDKHLDNLIRHIELVQSGCLILGKKMIEAGETHLGLALIARGYCHDNSKFYGIEFDYLHNHKPVPDDELKLAIRHHTLSNDHHSEFWGHIKNMPEIAIAEMTVDFYARAQEFGTDLRKWINEEATTRFDFKVGDKTHKTIMRYVDLLLGKPFKKLK